MSSHPSTHNITLSQSSQELEQPHRPESPCPSPSHESENPMQHFYSPLLSSPPLGSSPASVVYSPLPSQSQSQQSLALPLLKQAQGRTKPRRPQSQLHPLLASSIPQSSHQGQDQHSSQNENQNQPPQSHFPHFSTFSSLAKGSFPSPSSPTRNLPPSSHSLLPSFPNSPTDSSSSSSSSESSTRQDREWAHTLTWEEYEQEMAVRRAKKMCAWFTGVMVGVLVGVGGVRWWIYG